MERRNLLQSLGIGYQMPETFVRSLPTYGASKQGWLAGRPDEVWSCRGGGAIFEVGETPMTQYALAGAVQMARKGAGPGADQPRPGSMAPTQRA
jgi:hypothetical protein